MYQGQVLIRGSATTKVYSPWFERKGDKVIISGELIALDGSSPHFIMRLYTKSKETATDGTVISPTGTLIDLTTVGRASCEYATINELVRYGFEITGAAGDSITFRALPPVWFDAVQGP
jgi:hypothetical protein